LNESFENVTELIWLEIIIKNQNYNHELIGVTISLPATI